MEDCRGLVQGFDYQSTRTRIVNILPGIKQARLYSTLETSLIGIAVHPIVVPKLHLRFSSRRQALIPIFVRTMWSATSPHIMSTE